MPSDLSINTRQFRHALGAFATGVTIVTTHTDDGVDVGLTANSFSSVSLEPPMVLWSLAKTSRALGAFMGSKRFAVHILDHTQQALSSRFAKYAAQKFDDLPLDRGIGGVPIIRGCAATFQCRTAFQYEGGDHVIFVGEVLKFEHSSRPPLVFHSGKYAVAVAPPEAADQDTADSSELDSSFSQDFLVYLLGRAHFQLFLGLRSELEHHGLSEDEWFVISILGVSGDRTVDQLDRRLFYTGKRVSYRLVARLASAGFVTLHGGHDPHAKVNLTHYGMDVVVKLVAAAKSVEAQSQRGLNVREIRQLKALLRRIIQNTKHAVPAVLPTVDPD